MTVWSAGFNKRKENGFRNEKVKIIFLLWTGILCITGCGKIETGLEKIRSEKATIQPSGENDGKITQELFAMDTYMTITAYGENAAKALDEAEKKIMELDETFSAAVQSGEVGRLNDGGEGVLSEDTNYLLQQALQIYKDTDGCFNPAIYPVMQLWGFPDKNYRVPTDEELKGSLALTDASEIFFEEESSCVTFGIDGMKIDFGGIAKGYASQKVIDIFKENKIESGMVNLGGNVWALGRKTDGSKWRVAIRHPENEEDYLGVLSLEDKAVITSGGYERFFEMDGKTYHHIIDPKTGYPAESGLLSVSVISSNGTLADAMSTALFVMGRERACQYWQEHKNDFDMVLFTEEGDLYITDGIADMFTSDFDIHIIEGITDTKKTGGEE